MVELILEPGGVDLEFLVGARAGCFDEAIVEHFCLRILIKIVAGIDGVDGDEACEVWLWFSGGGEECCCAASGVATDEEGEF